MTSRKRNIRVRGARRAEPDVRKLGRALIALAQAQAEADARAEHDQQAQPAQPKPAADQPQGGAQ